MKQWGNDVFLNGDAIFRTINTIQNPGWEHIFIRPVNDTKKLIATVIEHNNFEYSIKKYCSTHGDEDLEVMIAPVKDIISEYRLFIVNSKVVAGSLYKVKGVFCTNP